MIKTFKVTNGSVGKTGNVSTQRVIADDVQNVSAATITTTQPVIVKDEQSSTKKEFNDKNNASIESIVNAVVSDKIVAIPVTAGTNSKNVDVNATIDKNVSGGRPKIAGNGVISPANNVHVDPTAVSSALKSAAAMKLSAEKVEVYEQDFVAIEQITGISQERPEVIQVTNFLPIFKGQSGGGGVNRAVDPSAGETAAGTLRSDERLFTPAGQLFDALYKTRLVKVGSIASTADVLSTLDGRGSATFAGALAEATAILQAFLSVLQRGNDLKRTLAVRDIICDARVALDRLLNVDEVNVRALGAFGAKTTTINSDALSSMLPASQFTIGQCLTSLSFNPEAVGSIFSSSKLWLQLLHEFKIALKHSTDQLLDAPTQSQMLDVDPVRINKHSLTAVRLGSRGVTVLPYNGYTKIPSPYDVVPNTSTNNDKLIDAYVAMLSSAHGALVNDVTFSNDETRIVALCNFVSQEYRYSYALNDRAFVSLLERQYGFTVNNPDEAGNNNVGFVDSVIGVVPDRVYDIASGNSAVSLVSAAQRINGDVAVLPFESRYLELDDSTFTPGSTFYVDSTLNTDGVRFNTSRTKDYYAAVGNIHKALHAVARATNIVMAERPMTTSGMSSDAELANLALNDPRSLFTYLLNRLTGELHFSGDNTPFNGLGDDHTRNSVVWGVFAYASKSPRVMVWLSALLSSYLPRPAWLTSHPNNGPTSTNRSAIAGKLLAQIEKEFSTLPTSDNSSAYVRGSSAAPHTASGGSVTVSNDDNQLRAELLKQNGVVESVGNALSGIYETITKIVLNNPAFRTAYSGLPHALMNLVVLELVCVLANSYGNVQLTNIVTGNNSVTPTRVFKFTVSYNSYDASFTNVNARLEAERGRVQSMLAAVLSTLESTSYSLKTYIDLLEPTMISGANKVPQKFISSAQDALQMTTQLLGDPAYTNLLLSEQQLMTSLSTVRDIESNVSASPKDAFVAIDELTDTPSRVAFLDVLYSVFSDRAFSSVSGYNKRIMSVGLPAGFTKKFKQRRSSVTKVVNDSRGGTNPMLNKVHDVVRVVVRKIDLRYEELVFKPIKFLFDLSRYSARTPDAIIKPEGSVTLPKLSSYVASRDFGGAVLSSNVKTSSGIEFYPQRTWDKSIEQGANANTISDTYEFLTPNQRLEIHQNHAMSYVLESYVRVMTGLNLAEGTFAFDTQTQRNIRQDLAEEMMQTMLSRIFTQRVSQTRMTHVFPLQRRTTAAPPQQMAKAQQPQQGVQSLVGAITSKNQANDALEVCKQASMFMNTFGTLSSREFTIQRLLFPKQFDRVFNVIIDPDDFEIDLKETNKTLVGKQTLESLVSAGEIVQVEQQYGSMHQVVYVSREKTKGDVAFEKFIVTIESLDDDGVQ